MKICIDLKVHELKNGHIDKKKKKVFSADKEYII